MATALDRSDEHLVNHRRGQPQCQVAQPRFHDPGKCFGRQRHVAKGKGQVSQKRHDVAKDLIVLGGLVKIPIRLCLVGPTLERLANAQFREPVGDGGLPVGTGVPLALRGELQPRLDQSQKDPTRPVNPRQAGRLSLVGLLVLSGKR